MIRPLDYRAAFARALRDESKDRPWPYDIPTSEAYRSRDIMFDDYATETFETVVWC
jgi:hypothetical protein